MISFNKNVHEAVGRMDVGMWRIRFHVSFTGEIELSQHYFSINVRTHPIWDIIKRVESDAVLQSTIASSAW